jgi:hypothetical protein
MYTVIRVLPNHPGVDLTLWVDAVNSAGVVQPLKEMSSGRGYVADICDDSSWDAHLGALHACAVGLGRTLDNIEPERARVVVDVAVNPEDREWLLFDIDFPPVLLADLGAAGVSLIVTFYAGPEPAN